MITKLGLQIVVNDSIVLTNFDPMMASEHFKIVTKNRDFFGQWLTWTDSVYNIEDSRKYINSKLENQNSGFARPFHILFQNKLVGQISLFDMKPRTLNAEISYWLDEDHTGKGIMTESVKAILKYGFETLNLHRIVIKASTKNYKSQAIPLRLGFKYEGTLRESNYIRGVFLDSNIYSQLDHEFKNYSPIYIC